MKLKAICVLLGVAAATSALASTAPSNQDLHKQIKSLQSQISSLQSQVKQINVKQTKQKQMAAAPTSASTHQYIQLNPMLTGSMMDNFGGVSRELNILNAKSQSNSNALQNNTLYLGGYVQSGVTGNFANAELNGTDAKSTSNVSADRVSLDFLTNFNQYFAAYFQIGASDVGQSGATNTPAFQQAYVLLGNGDLPVYGFIGLKDIDFGNFSSVNMFAQPLTREFFMATGDTAGVGYNANGLNFTVSVMNGGANGTLNDLAAGNWDVPYDVTNGRNGLYTTSSHQISNVAVNASYGQNYSNSFWRVGTGYLNGAGIGANAASTNTTTGYGIYAKPTRVAAWDLNAQAGYNNFGFVAEYVTTLQKGTFATNGTPSVPATIPLKGGSGRVNAWDLGTSYTFNAGMLPNTSVVSFDYSGVKINADTPFNDNQLVLGLRNQIFPQVWAGVEYGFSHMTGVNTASGSVYNDNNLRLNLTANF